MDRLDSMLYMNERLWLALPPRRASLPLPEAL